MTEADPSIPTAVEFDVFISYEKTDPDRQFARWLYYRLCDAGLNVAIDDASLIAGEHQVAGQSRLVENSRRTVAVISEAYLASGFCRSDVLSSLYVGMEDRASRVIPVALEVEIPTDLPLWLRALVPIPWHEEAVLVEPWDRLMRAILHPDQPRPPAPVRSWRRYESALAPHASADLKLKPIRGPDAARSEFDLLRASYRATTLVGREADLEALNGWLLENDRLSVRVIAGPAGVGKTRLAHELIRGVPEGWQAGLIEPRDLVDLDKSERKRPWRWDSPTLAVIDYASEAGSALPEWIEALAGEPEPGSPPLRVLLLDRGASDEVGWFSGLRQEWDRGSRGELGPVPIPLLLTPLERPAMQLAVFQQAREAALALHGQDQAKPLSAESAAELIRTARWSEPLSLMMAGVLSHWIDAGGLRGRSPRQLASDVARRERARILRHPRLHAQAGELAVQAVARFTVAGGSDAVSLRSSLREIAQQLGPEYGPLAPETREPLLDVAARQDSSIDPLRPDLPAEAFVLTELFGDNSFGPDAAAHALEFAWKRDRATAISFWIRMIHDFSDPAHPEVHHSRRASEALDLLCRRAEQEPEADRLDLSRALLDSLPDASLALRDAALQWARWQVEALRQRPCANGVDELWEHSIALGDLSVRLSGVGRWEEALEYAQEAVRADRRLACGRPETFLPALATSLNNLGMRLSEMGQQEEALTAADEAVWIRRQLAEIRPDVFLPDLAMSLNNAGAILSKMGHWEEALGVTAEAVTIQRGLKEWRPDAFQPDLAMSLSNLANVLSRLERLDEALTTADEAVTMYRELVEWRPDAFQPVLARSLCTLGTMLSAVGRPKAALDKVEESVATYRCLVERHPDAFQSELGTSLNNLGILRSQLGRKSEALAAADEAVMIQRRLAESRTEAAPSDLAMALHNKGTVLSELGRYEDGLLAVDEAVSIRRQLVESHPDAVLPDLASSLQNSAMMLMDLKRWDDALNRAEEAVMTYRQMATSCPNAFLSALARSCFVMGLVLRGSGQQRAALASFEEGLRAIAQPLAVVPAAFLQLSLSLAQDYLQSCVAAGCEPDVELLQPVMTAVQRVEHGQEGEGEDV